jgi:hypothetical protein
MKFYRISWILLFLCIVNKNYAQTKSIPEIDYYFTNEILNDKVFSGNMTDRKKFDEYYGMPLEEIIETSEHLFYIAVRKLLYDDVIHYFYISNDGEEVYNGVEINKPLERLKTINIGDSINKLKETFGNECWEDNNDRYGHNIFYEGLYFAGIIFYIEDDIIIKIFCSYFSWE